MGPKKAASRASEAAALAKAAMDLAQWRYRNDNKATVGSSNANIWSDYSEEDNTAIEMAYLAGKKTATLASGKYSVDTRDSVQINLADANKRRSVKRFVLGTRTKPLVTHDVDAGVDTETDVEGPPLKRSKADQQKTAAERAENPPPMSAPAKKAVKPPALLKDFTMLESPTAENSTGLSLTRNSSGSTAKEMTPTKTTSSMLSTSLSSDAAALLDLASVTRDGKTDKFRLYGADLLKGGRPVAKAPPRNTSPTKAAAKPKAAVAKSRMAPGAVASVIAQVIAKAPKLNKMALDKAGDLMRPSTRNWLIKIGREESQSFTTSITLGDKKTIFSVPQNQRVRLSDKFTTNAGRLQQLASESIITYVGPKPSPSLFVKGKMSGKQQMEAQLLLVSGPVLVLYDEEYCPVKDPAQVVMCSTPGINFAYSDAEAKIFLKKNDEDDEDGSGAYVINQGTSLQRMMLIWAHTLVAMDEMHGVQFPILCGIGCGAFRGPFGARVPRLWAQALYEVLSQREFHNIEAVFVSLPTFGAHNNFGPFKLEFDNRTKAKPLKVPVIFIEDAGMLSMATMIARMGFVSAVLNPSDVEAVRQGKMGMYWDGGHTALEEVLAMQTTLLLSHVGVNPDLFRSESKQKAVSLKMDSDGE